MIFKKHYNLKAYGYCIAYRFYEFGTKMCSCSFTKLIKKMKWITCT